ncbi:MAG TPA: hypothetical protein PKU78_02635 [Candidatus Dojkabacteria bacterium]|nr:hypothetical protein [Candidatus Dojkabacteria bacterium]HRO65093.1 hypothetical protein [Candidatus Dojkabacteria bacterium]HRP51176.1 hypothetical protein [Candidatus Dojkabacteria bacterium]
MLQSEKTWYTMVLIGFLEVLIFIAYQFYTSITGQNVDLVKKIDDTPISPELGIEKLTMKPVLEGNILIQNSDLD